MRSKITVVGIIAIVSIAMLGFSGGLLAGEGSGSKDCPMQMSKMEGKGYNQEMCKKMEEHREALRSAVEKMGEHLDAMKEIQSDREWRQEMENHMTMLQGYLEEMANCPMHEMMHQMMHGEKGEMGSESK